MNESPKVVEGFDLFCDPWITCVTTAGEVGDYSIESLLAEAHELSEIVDPSPLVTVSVLRLLEAVIIWSLDIDDEDGWYEFWRRGRFDEQAMGRVRECCAGRMDLFDAVRPFYQSRDIPSSGAGEHAKSVGYLFPDIATGTAVALYAHGKEDEHSFCPRCCAQGLVMLPAFATSGGQGIKPSINGVPPTYLFALGDTVFQTLVLNCVLADARPPMASRSDPGPAWACDGVVGHKEERADVGFIESLTWQPRRVRLLGPPRRGTCSRCGTAVQMLTTKLVMDQGLSRPREAAPWLDPWAAYLWRTEKTGVATVRPLRPREERQTWRDTGALFLASVPESEADARGRPSRPTIVTQLAHLAHALGPECPAQLRHERYLAVGIRTDMKAKVYEWRSDRFELPSAVLGEPAAPPVVRALRFAEVGADALGGALLRLHPGTERDNPPWSDIRSAMADTTTDAAREYWTELEPPFRSALFDTRLAEAEQAQSEWLREWIQTVRDTAVRVVDSTLDSGDDTAAGLRRQEAARRSLYALLKKGGVV